MNGTPRAAPKQQSGRYLQPRPKTRWVVALTLLLAAGGCVDQEKEVAIYRKVLDNPSLPPPKRDYAPGQQLTLEGALLLANRYEERLAIQGEDYLQGLIARDRAYAAFMPTISLSPTFSWQNKPLNRGGTFLAGGTGTTTSGSGLGGTTGGTSTGTVVSSSNKYTALDLPVNARANLFNGFRDVAAIRAAYADVRRRRGLLLDLQATVLLETAQVYYQVLQAERSVEVLRNTVEFQDARVKDMLGRLKAGIAQPLDYAQSLAQEAATEAQLVSAQTNVQNGRIMLAFLTNANVEKAALVDRLDVPQHLPTPAEAVAVAEEIRPDIAAATAAVEVSRQNVQAALGEYYPSISLNLNYYLSRETVPTNVEWAGLLTGNLPIFTGGTIHADVRLAWSQLRQSTLTKWQLIRQVSQDVQTAWQNLVSSKRRIDDLDTEVAAAQEALRQATQRYQAGLAINLDVLNAENQLLSAQLDLANEEFNHKIFYLDLLRVMGRLPLPGSLTSMSSGPASRPTTEQTRPIAPPFEIAPMTLPEQRSVPEPTTQPATEPTTQP